MTSEPGRLPSCSPSTPRSRRRSPTPRSTPTQAPGPHARAVASPSWRRVVATAGELEAARGDLAAARELAAEDSSFAAEAQAADHPHRRARGPTARPAAARRTRTTARTSSSRSRPGRVARSRRCSPATCCGCTCATPSGRAGPSRSSTTNPPTSAARSRRRSRSGRASADHAVVGAAEVRGRRASRPARARPPSRRAASTPPRPACWCCPRPRTSRSRSTRTTCASTSTARRARAARASTPPTPRCGSRTSPPARSCRCRTRRASCRTARPALRVLRARLLAAAQEQADAAASDARRSQVRTVDRSERVRTYNFPENRISDHRVGFKAYNLDQVLDGALDDVIDALQHADIEALLAGHASRDAGADRDAARGGDRPAGRPPGSRRRASTPSCCWRTCSASRGAGCSSPASRLPSRPPRFEVATRASDDPRAAAAHRRARRRSATSSCGRAGRVRAHARRPSCSSTRCCPALRAPRQCAAGRRPVRRQRARSRWRSPTRCPAARVDRRRAARRRRDWLARNVAGTVVEMVLADVARSPTCCAELRGRVDAVVSNPPYVPTARRWPTGGARTTRAEAVFAGTDGLALMPAVVARAGELLRRGGVLAVEHDESHAEPAGAGPASPIADGRDSPTIRDRDDRHRVRPRYAVAACARF